MRSAVFVPPLILTSFLLAAPQAERYSRAVVRGGDTPGVRYHSGLSVCDEALIKGHWVTRYRLTTGMVKPEHAIGQFNIPAAKLSDAFELSLDGQKLDSWKWVNATEEHSGTGLLSTVELQSTVRPVTVKIRTRLSGGPVMVRWLEITNRGGRAAAITRVSPWSGMIWDTPTFRERLERGTAPFEIAHAEYQEWGQEGAWRFDPLESGVKSASSIHGKSGWGHPTFFAHNMATGEWAVGSLGYSGNWQWTLTAATGDRARLSFSIGPVAADAALRVIDPNETVRTPEMHLVVMASDFDHVVQALHEHVRRDVMPPPIPGREYQVESNHRGYIIDHEDEAGLIREVDLAHDAGAEEFLIDAGWYGPEPNRWSENQGDWYAGKWLPNDITPVREHARKLGMLFGLWVEIESAGPASALKKAHPDWLMRRDGALVSHGAQLDLTKPEVAAWVESEIARIITRYDLDMFRLDYNHSMDDGGNRVKDGITENLLWRYYDALYGIFDRIHQRFPKVILQNCAGGGGRLDYGMLRRFHNTELSDWARGPRGIKILNGMTWVLPPEVLLRIFGTEAGEHETDGDLSQQLRATMIARPIIRGIAPTQADLNPITRKAIRDAVQSFKSDVRPIMLGSRVFHHTPRLPMLEASPWVVLEYAGPDAARAVASFFRTSTGGEDTFVFRPRGLDFGRTYRVRLMNTAQTVEVTGAQLLTSGLPVRIENPMGSEMLIFDAK